MEADFPERRYDQRQYHTAHRCEKEPADQKSHHHVREHHQAAHVTQQHDQDRNQPLPRFGQPQVRNKPEGSQQSDAESRCDQRIEGEYGQEKPFDAERHRCHQRIAEQHQDAGPERNGQRVQQQRDRLTQPGQGLGGCR